MTTAHNLFLEKTTESMEENTENLKITEMMLGNI